MFYRRDIMHRRKLDYIKKLNFADIDSVEKLKKH